MYCQNCGARNNDNCRFCADCGNDISVQVPSKKSLKNMEEYILTQSYIDDEDKLDGKNTGVYFFDTHITIKSYKQNGGFEYSISYHDILGVTLGKVFSPLSLIIGIAITITGLLLIINIESAWYNHVIVWLVFLSGIGVLISDVNKIKFSVHTKSGQIVQFITNDRKKAENLKIRIENL